jgi:hypothetical protein
VDSLVREGGDHRALDTGVASHLAPVGFVNRYANLARSEVAHPLSCASQIPGRFPSSR